MTQRLKRLPAMQETQVQSLGQEDPLEKEMATHSSVLAWRIPWKEEPGGLQSLGSQRVRHDWVMSISLILIKKKTQQIRTKKELSQTDDGNLFLKTQLISYLRVKDWMFSSYNQNEHHFHATFVLNILTRATGEKRNKKAFRTERKSTIIHVWHVHM